MGRRLVAGGRLPAVGVRTFVRRHDAKFGPDGAQQVTFFFDRVDAEIPVGGSDARVQEWSWDGVWRRIGEAKEVEGAAEVVDPAALDVKALFRNVDVATEGLGARGAEIQRIVVRPGNDGQGSVTIHVRDDRGGTARLETTLQGSRVREVPFEG